MPTVPHLGQQGLCRSHQGESAAMRVKAARAHAESRQPLPATVCSAARTAFEYAMSHDGGTGETTRKYGPLILADRYVVAYNDFVSGVQAELV